MILGEILTNKRREVEELKLRYPLRRLQEAVERRDGAARRSFAAAIGDPHRINLIAELKKASPSEGVLRENFQPLRLAALLEYAGAAALSVLTETRFFKGRPSYLKTVRQVTQIPILRKDFIVDEYQIYESRILEADAILLIASVLTDKELSRFIERAESVGLEALVEVHSEEDLKKAIEAGARMIGVNNRNLQTLEVDVNCAARLLRHIPKEAAVVVESGFKDHEEILKYKSLGIHAFLVGTALMKAEDIVAKVHELLRGKG
jgi:indole-3-glycerol phosphate synthase